MTRGDGFAVAGLFLDIAGAAVFGWGILFTTKSEAVDVTAARWASEDPDEMAKTPAVRDRLKQRTFAWVGMGLLIGGFTLQIISYVVR